MRATKTAFMSIVVAIAILSSAIAFAGGHRGGGYHRGGGHGGYYKGWGGHGGYYGGWGGHSRWYGGVSVGFGGPYWGPSWYYPGPYYYPYSPYYYPYYYPSYYPAYTVPSAPQDYIERDETEPSSIPSGVWYYCPDAKGYYPYVRECPGDWQAVPAEPPSDSER